MRQWKAFRCAAARQTSGAGSKRRTRVCHAAWRPTTRSRAGFYVCRSMSNTALGGGAPRHDAGGAERLRAARGLGRSVEAGFDHHLAKPLKVEKLEELLTSGCRTKPQA